MATSSVEQRSPPQPSKTTQLTHDHSSQAHSSVSGMNISLMKLYDIAAPLYKVTADLLPERFVEEFPDLVCPICLHVADQSVQSPCCTHLFCTPCISYWLQSSMQCPVCKSGVLASSLLAPNRIVRGVLGTCMLSCDFFASPWSGCPAKMHLMDLKDHVAQCMHNPHHTGQPLPRVVSSASTVDDILTASPSKLQGAACEKTLSHLVKARASGDRLEVKTGGCPQVWTRTPVALVDSKEVNLNTLKRRSSVLKQRQALVCGSTKGASFQSANDLRKMKTLERDRLLSDAGLKGGSVAPGTALALKADLHLPWHQLWKLNKWLGSFGVRMESERSVRSSIRELPKYIAEDTPMATRNGPVSLSPMVYIPDLVNYILFMLDSHSSADTLVWHNGMPHNEVWVKLGGDHGGGSFKFCLQIVNVHNPNVPANTVVVAIFSAKDLAANLETTLGQYRSQLALLSGTQWQGMSLRVISLGTTSTSPRTMAYRVPVTRILASFAPLPGKQCHSMISQKLLPGQ